MNAQHTPGPSFDTFWRDYPHPREGDRTTAANLYGDLSPADRAAAHRGLAEACASAGWQIDDGRYVPPATLWLRGRRWVNGPVRAKSGGAQ